MSRELCVRLPARPPGPISNGGLYHVFRQEQALSACFWNLLSRFQVLGLSGYLLETEMRAFSPFLNCVRLFTYLFIYLLTYIYLFI